MRDKNIKRAAHALYLSQGDDKNALLSKKIFDPKVKELVKDQGRALVVLEKLILPTGKDAYEENEMYGLLTKKLLKKGHRIQEDDAVDDEQYTQEKKRATEARLKKVPSFLGMKLEEEQAKEASEKPQEAPQQPRHLDEGITLPTLEQGVEPPQAKLDPPNLLEDIIFCAIIGLGGYALSKLADRLAV